MYGNIHDVPKQTIGKENTLEAQGNANHSSQSNGAETMRARAALPSQVEEYALSVLLKFSEDTIRRRMLRQIGRGKFGWYNPTLVSNDMLRSKLLANLEVTHTQHAIHGPDYLDVAILALMLVCRNSVA